MKQALNIKLGSYCSTIENEFNLIDGTRKKELESLADYVGRSLQKKRRINLIFVCTHNSRRSQLAQVWFKVAAEYYGVRGIATFSGGTEVSEVNIRVIGSLERAGITIECLNPYQPNPVYNAVIGEGYEGLELFSKVYNDPANPDNNYCAVMVCSDADEACPNVPGADLRIAIPYTDPKYSDNSPAEADIYDTASRTIAREMFYAISLITKIQ
ncbi:MAG TPA: hypothetical protein VMW76_00500 [Bacteroidales bacterium]|nr:hypothetical protein [Bacteroidales bacterium]